MSDVLITALPFLMFLPMAALAVVTILWRRADTRARAAEERLSRELARHSTASIQGEGYRAHLHVVQ